MDAYREELSFPSASPPYADPVIILAPRSLDNTANVALSSVPSRTQLHNFYDRFLKLFEYFISSAVILVLLLFAIYQIALACYNCNFESTDLGWIRASFFLNFPFVLGVFVYIITALMLKKPPPFAAVMWTAAGYTMPFICYSIFLGFYGEIPEATQIRSTLANATALDLLPCPARYYRHVLGMKIANWCSPVILIPLFCLWFCQDWCRHRKPNAVERCDRFILPIVNRRRYCMAVIFRRHIGETVIQQF